MSNGLLYIAGFVSLVLAALFAVPYFVDWNGYRGVFEEEATRILGREVRVGGNVNVRLLPAPFVRFEKLRIADTTGIVGEPFFRADSFTMRLSVPPLLKGVIEANEIELKRPVLRLALDGDGGGNWRSFSITPGALPFVPADVTLQSVKIVDGLVTLQGPKGNTFAELDGLNGELKADSIQGPFAFKGTTKWHDADREVRIATDAADAEGAVRFKTTIRGAKHDNAYTVEGRLLDLKGSPRVTGEVTAKLELDAPPAAAQPPPTGDGKAAETTQAPLVDFKSGFTGDAKSLKLEGITLSFDRVGQPQLISGSAAASWTDAFTVELNLASRWLDLDRISGSSAGESPFDTARGFISAVMQSLPTEAETKVRFDLDQATLGGEAVSGIRIEVARNSGALLLKELRAGLPGGAKLALYGAAAENAEPGAFRGELALRGTSLARFLNWVAKDDSVAEAIRSDGPFALQGRFGMNAQSVDLTEAGAEIGGTPLTGEVHYRAGERARLAVVLQGQQIDAAKLWPAGVGYLKGLLAGPADTADAATTDAKRPHWLDTARSDLSLRLRAGSLATGRQPLHDVDFDIALEQGQFALRACKFVTDDGLSFDLDGRVADVAGDRKGTLHWVVAAPDKNAFTSLVRLWDLPDNVTEQVARYAALMPMRLAGTIRLGERGKTTADILADGSLLGGRLAADARLDGGLANWRAASTDLAITVDSPDVVQALNALAVRSGGPAPERRERPGQFFVKAVGVPANGMLTAATVKAAGLYLAYDGKVGLAADGTHSFNGDVRVSSRELGDVMAIAGLGNGSAPRGVSVIGALKMVSTNQTIELKPQQLAVGGSNVAGTVALAYPAEGPAIVTAQLQVDSATIPGLLGLAVDRGATAAVPEQPATATQAKPVAEAKPVADAKSIWPESPFDFAALDGIDGKLGIAFDTLSLEEGMAISKAQLEVQLAPGKITLTKLEGSALGGTLAAKATLEKGPGGATLNGDVQLSGAHLTTAAANDAAKADNPAATLSLEFSGRGATPDGLIAVASGKGAIELGDMAMRVPTPLAVVATSEAVLSGGAGGSGDELIAALKSKIADSEVKVGPRKIAIDVADGAAKLEAFTLPSPAGTTTVTTTVDLSSLMVDSAWLLEPRAPDVEQPDKPRKGALPSVSFVYVGPLKDAWMLQPRITADQLERELAIRKMELDADQLERLHKADAERAQREDERRKSLETDQSAPSPQPGPQPAPGPGPGAAAAPPGANPAATPPVGGAPAPQPQATAPIAPSPLAPAPLPPTPLGELGGDPVPALPGAEAQIPPLPPVDGNPATLPPSAAAAQPLPPGANRAPQRRVQRRQDPVGDQVLRALQNSTN